MHPWAGDPEAAPPAAPERIIDKTAHTGLEGVALDAMLARLHAEAPEPSGDVHGGHPG